MSLFGITDEEPPEYHDTGATWGEYLKFLEKRVGLKSVQVLFLRVLVTQYFKKPLSSPIEPQRRYLEKKMSPGYFALSILASEVTITVDGQEFGVNELFNVHYQLTISLFDKIPTEDLPQYLDLNDPFINILIKARLERG